MILFQINVLTLRKISRYMKNKLLVPLLINQLQKWAEIRFLTLFFSPYIINYRSLGSCAK